MAINDEKSFEALLKPLQDINSEVWDIALTKALENYLVQINNGAKNGVNFTEAAVLVQNSASFYCKRVDSVHLGCQQFVEKLMDTYNKVFGTNRIMDVIIHDNLDPRKDKENKETGSQAVKKKRTAKTYVNDDFEPIGPFFSDSNINVNLDTIDKYAEKKKVILNKYPKTTRKPNTSCPVFQTKGAELGLKEEFRLNWRVSSNGVLTEDFIQLPTLLDWCSLPDDVFDEARNCLIELENSLQMDIDANNLTNLAAPSPVSSPFRPPSPHPDSPPHQQSPHPAVEIPAPEKRTIEDPYKELLFNFVTPPHEFFKKKLFMLPKDIIKDIKVWKLRKTENKENACKPDYMFSSFFDFLKHRILLHCPSTIQVNLVISAKQRRKEIKQRLKLYGKAVAEAAQDFDDDFHGFDGDNDVLDDIQNIDLKIGENADIRPVEIGGFTQDRDDIMKAAKDLKRKDATEQIEVARRVQAWHESLADVLDNAEARAQFDVHNYGTMILEHFHEPPEMAPVVQFADVVRNQPKHEVSRYLLSTLMLANTNNVELITEPGELVKDKLSLKLLSTVRHHEEMDENLRSNTHC